MPLRMLSPLPEFGLAATDQLVPFHRSMSVLEVKASPELPTAKQLLTDGQWTASSLLMASTLGLATIDHAVPFQRTASVFVVVPLTYSPTAMHIVAVGHDTPESRRALPGFGLATTDQLE